MDQFLEGGGMGQFLERGVLSKFLEREDMGKFLEKSCVGGKRGNTHTVKFDRKREGRGKPRYGTGITLTHPFLPFNNIKRLPGGTASPRFLRFCDWEKACFT